MAKEKSTVTVVNRSYTTSLDGQLPRVSISLSTPPWETPKKPYGELDNVLDEKD